eukprot:3521294-Prymnesium_polylepis.1
MPATTWVQAYAAAAAPPPDGLMTRLRTWVVEGETSQAERGFSRGGLAPSVWTALHGGNLDLVRLCISARADWAEERRASAPLGRQCKVVWVDNARSAPADAASRALPCALGDGQLLSRLDGM